MKHTERNRVVHRCWLGTTKLRVFVPCTFMATGLALAMSSLPLTMIIYTTPVFSFLFSILKRANFSFPADHQSTLHQHTSQITRVTLPWTPCAEAVLISIIAPQLSFRCKRPSISNLVVLFLWATCCIRGLTCDCIVTFLAKTNNIRDSER